MLGLVVAAAGNFKEDVMMARRDLGRVSIDERTVLTVENYSSGNNQTCGSSFFPAGIEAVKLRRIVGYRGGRASQGDFRCGTSFSAPRVGWFIAAFLSTRDPMDSRSQTMFSEDLWRAVANASPSLVGNPAAYAFDPVKLLPP
jgi:hypothetical protein